MKQQVIFCVATYSKTVTLGFWQSTMETHLAMMPAGIEYAYIAEGGDPYLSKARNLLVQRAFDEFPDFTDLMFIDDDVKFSRDALLRIIQSPFDVAAGIYPHKKDDPSFPCEPYVDQANDGLVEMNGWVRARKLPTGFLRIKRHVLDKLREGRPTYRDMSGRGIVCSNIFDMGYRPHRPEDDPKDATTGHWWGEDYELGLKLEALGIESWVYPDLTFGHSGQKTWVNNYYDAAIRWVKDGIKAWGPVPGQFGFFPTAEQIPPGWTTTKPAPAPAPDAAAVEPEPAPEASSPPVPAEAA